MPDELNPPPFDASDAPPPAASGHSGPPDDASYAAALELADLPEPADLPPPADPQVAQLRIPPHSLEAESSVLGGLLLDNGTWDRVGDLLIDSDFYRLEHKLIYAACGRLINDSKPADVITVFEELQRQGRAEAAGGDDFGAVVHGGGNGGVVDGLENLAAVLRVAVQNDDDEFVCHAASTPRAAS